MRLFAAARETAGVSEVVLPAETVGDVLDALAAGFPGLDRILTACSVLVDGTRTTDRSLRLPGDTVVDVLPPYAGG